MTGLDFVVISGFDPTRPREALMMYLQVWPNVRTGFVSTTRRKRARK